MEDSGIPVLHRDAQVFSIWEGTTNVLSLDVIRAIEKEGAFPPFVKGILQLVSKIKGFDAEVAKIKNQCSDLGSFLQKAQGEGSDFVQASARKFSLALGRALSGALLLERAFLDQSPRSAEIARRWCGVPVALGFSSQEHRNLSRLLIG